MDIIVILGGRVEIHRTCHLRLLASITIKIRLFISVNSLIIGHKNT